MSNETGKENELVMGEGKTPTLEPCVAEDIEYLKRVNKDALRIFARKKFNYVLDCGGHIRNLRDELTKKVQIALNIIVENPEATEEEVEAIEKVIPRWLLHPVNKRINQATPALLARGDMIPCTEKGVPLESMELEKATEELEESDELEEE
jgi:hypothetical protein